MKIIILILAFIFSASLWGFYVSTHPPKIISTITPSDLNLAYEDVNFNVTDDISLSGWFIPSKDKKPGTRTMILLHGYPADKGDILPALAFLNDKYNLFLFDFRYFGQSEGSYSTAGAKETDDLVAAIKYLQSRGITEVGVFGFSMGGAVALMTAGQMPEIKVIISEASYARLSLMALELYRIPLFDYLFAWLTELWARLFVNVDVGHVSPEKAIRNVQVPMLIIHSRDDDVIPFSNALLIQSALKNNPRAEFWFQDNLSHGQFMDEYQKKISEFLQRNFP